jgi:hypothetical protein
MARAWLLGVFDCGQKSGLKVVLFIGISRYNHRSQRSYPLSNLYPMLSHKDLVENRMGINSVSLHRNRTCSRVNPSRVGLILGRVGRVRWVGVGWAGAGPSWATNWAEHGKSQGGPGCAVSK